MSGNPWNQTFSGLAFDLVDPDPSMISIKDIAISLANQCRFNGHTKRFYSVAEHSLYVSRVLPRDLAFCGLMHDAAEAYVGDMTSPMKSILCSFEELEVRAWRAIARRFSLPQGLPEEVRIADARMAITEGEFLMAPAPRPWKIRGDRFELREIGLDYPGQFGLPPREAHRRFLERFAELSA